MKFKKVKFLGAGSYGNVHLAAPSVPISDSDDFLLVSSSSVMAVKSATCYSSVVSLGREKKFLDNLVGSPYIVQTFGHDTSIESGVKTYNLMMEFARGGTLNGLIKQKGGWIAEAEAACYTEMLLQGLYCVHKKGIVHCDLKPDNILVIPIEERDGVMNHHHLKLADFGLARNVSEKEIVRAGQQFRNRGADLYASPESLTFGVHEATNDVWAMGCIVYEMITGQPVWRGSSREDLIDNVVFDEPDIPDYVSPSVRNFIEMCLKKVPIKRSTIPMLLRHPFMTSHSRYFRKTDDMNQSRNPFGLVFDPSTIRHDTFSDF